MKLSHPSSCAQGKHRTDIKQLGILMFLFSRVQSNISIIIHVFPMYVLYSMVSLVMGCHRSGTWVEKKWVVSLQFLNTHQCPSDEPWWRRAQVTTGQETAFHSLQPQVQVNVPQRLTSSFSHFLSQPLHGSLCAQRWLWCIRALMLANFYVKFHMAKIQCKFCAFWKTALNEK